MYTVVDLCLLCLTNSKNLKSISSEDADGKVILEKCQYILFEFSNFKPHITNDICVDCLENLNYIYNYKQFWLENIVKLNTYVDTLKKLQGSDKHCHVTLTDLKHLESSAESTKNVENNLGIENMHLNNEIQSDSIERNILPKEEILSKTIILPVQQQQQQETEFVEIVGNKKIRGGGEDAEGLMEHEDRITVEIQLEKFNDNNDVQAVKSQTLIKIKEEVVEQEELQTEAMRIPDSSVSSIGNKRIKSHTCNECQKSFTCLSRLKLHQKTHQKTKLEPTAWTEKPYKCAFCSKGFKKKSNMTQHERIHTGEKPFKCNWCDKAFNQVASWEKHERVHSGKKPFPCSMCDKAFGDSYTLSRHIPTHTGVRPFKCDICAREFIQLNDFKEHKISHTQEKQFVCKVCGLKFAKKSCLKVHKRTHYPEFKCNICGHESEKKSEFEDHKRTHTAKKVFTCHLCNQSFSYRNFFIKHQSTHINPEAYIYKCNMCTEAFSQAISLEIHKLQHNK